MEFSSLSRRRSSARNVPSGEEKRMFSQATLVPEVFVEIFLQEREQAAKKNFKGNLWDQGNLARIDKNKYGV